MSGLFIRRILLLVLARTNAKKGQKKERTEVKKRIEAQRAKPRTSISEIDALIGDEEQNGKQKKEKEKQGAGPQPSYPGPFSRLLRRAGIIR